MHNAVRIAALICLLTGVASRVLAADAPGPVTISGPDKSITVTAAQIAAMPHVTVKIRIHDVDHSFDGVKLIDLLTQVGAPSGEALRGDALADAVLVHSRDNYQAVLALSETDARFRAEPVILADREDGKVLDATEGLRLVAPGDIEPARSSKMIDKVTLIPLAVH